MVIPLPGQRFPVSRWVGATGVGLSLLALGAARTYAGTDAAAPETASADRIVLNSGSIPVTAEVGASPCDTVDQDLRDATGQEDVAGVLTRSLPAISSASRVGSGANLGQSNANVSSGATLGGSSVAIHGLPTLVLLDGRRVTDAAAAAAGGWRFTDVNLFPSALVKRIEVLKDGASAIYGTEAVGGVVNVILDQEFQGFEFSARYGFTEKSDVRNQRYSGIFGGGDDKTHLVFGLEYVEQDPIFDRDRPFAVPAYGTANYAGIVRAGGQPYILNPGLNSPVDANPDNPGAAGLANGAYRRATTTQVNEGFDLSRATTLTLDQTRLNFFGSGDRYLIGNHVEAFAEVLFASNYSQGELNAQPLSNATGVVIPATAPYNPFGSSIDAGNSGTLLVANRFVTNPRVFRQDTDFLRVVAGLKGEIVSNYNYEVALNASRDELTLKNFNLVNGANLNAAIAGGYNAAGVATPGGAFSLVDGHLQPALDFFARTHPAAALGGVFGTDLRDFETNFHGVDGKITAFPYFLPAGPIGIVVGGEWRHETLKANVDPPGTFLGNVSVGGIDVGRHVAAGFVDVQIPLVSPDMHIPFLFAADIDGAVRYEADDPGEGAWIPKFGFVLRPDDDIALRGTFSKSFLPPTLFETRGPAVSGFSDSVDLGAGSEQAQEITHSNRALGSTRTDNYTAGIVLAPHQVPGLVLNADFFHVEERSRLGTIPDVDILTSVNAQGPASPYAGLVRLGSFTGPTVTAPGQLAGNLPTTYIANRMQTLGGARIGGVDFGGHYTRDFGRFGQASVGIDGTYYFQYEVSTLRASKFYDVIGDYTGLASEVEPYYLTPQVSYTVKGCTVSALGNYIPPARDAHNVSLDPTPGLGGYHVGKLHELPRVRDFYTIDLRFSYEFQSISTWTPSPAPKEGGKAVAARDEPLPGTDSPLKLLDGLKLSAGIQNVTNTRPPSIAGSPDASNTDASIYDPYQRQYYFVVTKRF